MAHGVRRAHLQRLDLHGCPLLRASPTVKVMLHWPLGDAALHRGLEAARSCTKDLSHQGPRSLCQQSTCLECLEAGAPSRIRSETTSGRRKRHQLQRQMQEPETVAATLPAVPAGHKAPGDGAWLLCSTRVDTSGDT